MNLLQRLLPWLAVLCAACASSPSAPEGGAPLLVTLRNFKTGERFELASESHTDRVAYYSGERTDAARKVQTDEVMTAFVQELDRLGFGNHAQSGPSPSVGASDALRWGLEVESGPNHAHWLVGTSSPGEDWQEFQRCRDTFLNLYNITVSYQTVRNASGKSYFDEQGRPAEKPR